MHALPLMVTVLCVMALAYRYYSAFLAAKVFALDAQRTTPAHAMKDGQNYHPTHPLVLFGHHFAAISGAGPLIGPVLAAQFGYMPGLIWLLVGVVLGGAVQDFVILVASMRRGGKSLAEIARLELGPVAGVAAGVAILFVVVVALAGLGFAVVNALADSAWGTFTIAMSIPIALGMGWWIYGVNRGSPRAVTSASVVGVTLLVAAVVGGRWVAHSGMGEWFMLDKAGVTRAMMVYGFIASVLPVWLLLCPRDYLSSYMKIGTLALLVGGVILVNPVLRFPALDMKFLHGGPVVPGPIFPFVFITIMCGAISGFHALVSSGTTPKMISSETHARPIGYGCMLIESLVGVVSLMATAAMEPGDYYAINVPKEKWAAVAAANGLSEVQLGELTSEMGEKDLHGRSGGSVLLAVGMARILGGLPLVNKVLDVWYHFAIMFEALFILTTIDTGTRIARFLLQEFLGKVVPRFDRTDWVPGTVVSTAAVVGAWGYLIMTGQFSVIWPMFGIANQMLAAIALAIGTAVLIRMGKGRYAWTTLLPLLLVTVTTSTASYQMVFGHVMLGNLRPGVFAVNAAMIGVIVGCAYLIFGCTFLAWRRSRGAVGETSVQAAAR